MENRAKRFYEDNPFWQWMGFQVDEGKPGRVKVQVKPEFFQHQGFVHGGVMSALVDSAGAWAFIQQYGEGLRTINLAVQYLSPVDAANLLADAQLVRVGQRIVIVAVEVKTALVGPVATGQVIYNRRRIR